MEILLLVFVMEIVLLVFVFVANGLLQRFGYLMGRRHAIRDLQRKRVSPYQMPEKRPIIRIADGTITGETYYYRCPYCEVGFCQLPKFIRGILVYECGRCEGVWETLAKNATAEVVDNLLRPSTEPAESRDR